MGVGYILVNIDKEERVTFYNINTGLKLRELSGTVIASAIIAFYMLKNLGNKITFINDTDENFCVFGSEYSWNCFSDYTDATDQVVEEMIKEGIIKDLGMDWIDKEDNLYYRKLFNAYDSGYRPV